MIYILMYFLKICSSLVNCRYRVNKTIPRWKSYCTFFLLWKAKKKNSEENMIFPKTENDNGTENPKKKCRVKKISYQQWHSTWNDMGLGIFFCYFFLLSTPPNKGKGDLAKSATSFAGWFITRKPLYKNSPVKILAVWFIHPKVV